MKKLILLFAVGVLLVSGVFAESCHVARPYFGSVNCEETDGWSNKILLEDEDSWTCEVPTCEIVGMNMGDFSCSDWGTTSILTIIKNSEISRDCSNFGSGNLDQICEDENVYSISLHEGDTIKVDFSCNFGAPEGNPKLEVRYKQIKLMLYFDSGQGFLSGTEFCNSNEVYNDYKNKQLSNNNELSSLDISDEVISSDESEALSIIPSGDSLIPSQLSIDENYWFIYDWVERPSLIVNSFESKDVWCNPLDHSLTELERVKTNGDDCYLIPTIKLLETVSCCSSDECKGQYENQEIFCTDDFKCGFEGSCLADSDCGSSESCQEETGKYFLVNSYCDKNELDEYNKGSCKTDKKEVSCCSNSCSSGSYCDYDKGCTEVSYLSSEGKIKTGVEGANQEELNNSEVSGTTSSLSQSSSSTGTIILAVFLILIGGSIGFFIYTKNKNKNLKHKVKKDFKEHSKKCRKCGHSLKQNSKFCTKCGRRV